MASPYSVVFFFEDWIVKSSAAPIVYTVLAALVAVVVARTMGCRGRCRRGPALDARTPIVCKVSVSAMERDAIMNTLHEAGAAEFTPDEDEGPDCPMALVCKVTGSALGLDATNNMDQDKTVDGGAGVDWVFHPTGVSCDA